MKTTVKTVCAVLAAVLTVFLAACGGKGGDDTPDTARRSAGDQRQPSIVLPVDSFDDITEDPDATDLIIGDDPVLPQETDDGGVVTAPDTDDGRSDEPGRNAADSQSAPDDTAGAVPDETGSGAEDTASDSKDGAETEDWLGLDITDYIGLDGPFVLPDDTDD